MRGGKPRPSRHGRTSAPKFTRQKVTKPTVERIFDTAYKCGQIAQTRRMDDLFDLADAVDVLLDPGRLVDEIEQHLRGTS